jgi:transcriptional regulator with XRE-family HTH domain
MKTAKRGPIGQAILTARTKRGLSQFELDHIAGFALGTTAQYECGARVPTLHSAKCLAKALDMDAAVLVELA